MRGRLDGAWLSALATTSLTAACGASHSSELPSARDTSPQSAECLVDGVPLSSYQPSPVLGWSSERAPATETLANGLRLYAAGRYEEAAHQLSAEVGRGARPDAPAQWARARFYLAKSLVHLGQDDAARSLLLEIVRSPDEPYRWSAAGWMCGVQRTVLSLEWTPRGAVSDDAMVAAWRAASEAVAECGQGREGFVTVHLDVASNDSVTNVTLVAAGWYGADENAADGLASPYDEPTRGCVVGAMGDTQLPSGLEGASMTFPLR